MLARLLHRCMTHERTRGCLYLQRITLKDTVSWLDDDCSGVEKETLSVCPLPLKMKH